MKFRIMWLVLTLIIFLAVSNSCSSNQIPTEPVIDNSPVTLEGDQKTILAVYDVVIDSQAETFQITRIERENSYHFPVSTVANVIQITDFGFSPNFWADIKLVHPYPGSSIDCYDPRIIAIFPARPGVSFYYPVFNAAGNHSILLQPDSYTKLYDDLGGAIPGNTNPFMAYFRGQPNRIWSSTEMIEETRRWEMDLAGFGGPTQFSLVVDVSTNYPNPPQPGNHNAEEPAEIVAINVGSGLSVSGGFADIDVTFLDWQGQDEIKCKVEAPDLFNLSIQLYYSHTGPNPNEYVFSGIIPNSLLAPGGDYNILVSAWDIPSGTHIFNEGTAAVSGEIAFNPNNITPQLLNFQPMEAMTSGNYTYIGSSESGVHIFDSSNPANPIWVNSISTPARVAYIDISGNYAYLTSSSGTNGFMIMDISDPQTPQIVNSINIPINYNKVSVSGNYAYVASFLTGTSVIDISNPLTASIVHTISIEESVDVETAGNYAYVLDYSTGLQIVDISNPLTASVVHTVNTPERVLNLEVSGNYAYTSFGGDIYIIDITNPLTASIINTIDTLGRVNYISVSGNYAYVADAINGLIVIDISDPLTAAVVHTVVGVDNPRFLSINGSYAYLNGEGLSIIDISAPESAFVVNSKFEKSTSMANEVIISGNYAFAACSTRGFNVVDIDPPGSANVSESIDIQTNELDISGDYAYTIGYVDDIRHFYIFDISNPFSINQVFSLEMSTVFINDLKVSNGHAYLASSDNELIIIDVIPPETASIVNQVPLEGMYAPQNLHISGNYVFSMDSQDTINVTNITDPLTAYVEETIILPGDHHLGNLQISGGYAYRACRYHGLDIIDIDPLESASIVHDVMTPDATSVYLSGKYAYVANREYGLYMVDIGDPLTAFVKASFDIDPIDVQDVYVSNGIAYLTGYSLQIIDLW